MSKTHVHTTTVTGPSGGPFSKSVTVSGSYEVNLSEQIAGATTNQLMSFFVDVSALKSLYIQCDRALTIKTNSSGSPDNTLAIAANTPLSWVSTSGITCPLTADVTALYVTLAAGATATLEIATIQDATP